MFDRLKNVKEWILAAIAIITGLLGFYDLVLKPGNAHRIFIILFIAGNILLPIGGLEIFRKKTIRRINDPRRGPVEIKKPQYPNWLRYAALVIGLLIPVTSASWFSYKAYITPPKFIVLVAEFEKEGSQKFGVTQAIVDELNSRKKAPDVEIVGLKNTVLSNEDEVIDAHAADMLWWGFYEKRDGKEAIVVHCKIANKLMVENKSMLRSSSMEQNSDDPIFKEDRFTKKFRSEDVFKKVVALELGYATSYLVGLWHGNLKNYGEAYTDHLAALSRGAVPQQMTQPEDLLLNLGLSAFEVAKQFEVEGRPDEEVKKKYNEAISNISAFINRNPDNYKAYNYRAEAHRKVGMIEQANTDHRKAREIESKLQGLR